MSASAVTITVTGAAHDVDAAPVSARVESAFETPPTTMREIDSGRETPCQWAPDGAGGVLTWIERGLGVRSEGAVHGVAVAVGEVGWLRSNPFPPFHEIMRR